MKFLESELPSGSSLLRIAVAVLWFLLAVGALLTAPIPSAIHQPDTQLGATGRLFIHGITWLLLPLPALVQLSRVLGRERVGATGRRRTFRRGVALTILLLTVAAAITVVVSDFFFLPGYVESVFGMPPSPYIRTIMMQENVRWFVRCLIATGIAASFYALSART